MEQGSPQSRREQVLCESIELRCEELGGRVRDVEVCAWLVSAQSHDDHGTDVIAPVLGRGCLPRDGSGDRIGEEPDQCPAFLTGEQPIQRRRDDGLHLLNIGA